MKKPRVYVAVPCMKEIPFETVFALTHLTSELADMELDFIEGSLVYDARNEFCRRAVQNGFDYIMFIDSDMVFPAKVVDRLLRHDADIVTAVCYGRTGKHEPQVYKEMKPSTWYRKYVIVDRCTDVDGVFSIKACGMACCLIKTDLIKKMFNRNMNPFDPFGHLGEDFSFCVRARRFKAKMIADGTITIGHVGKEVFTKEDWVKE